MVVSIATSSLILLVFLQNFTESTVRKNIYEQQIDRQKEVTTSISQSIGSDLGNLVSVLDGLADSDLLQRGDFASDETTKLVNEKLQRYGAEVNNIFLLDSNNIVTVAMPGPNTTTDYTDLRAGDDLSQRKWVKDTRTKSEAPYFSGGFERQGIYKEFITFPILDRETNEKLGIVGASISTAAILLDCMVTSKTLMTNFWWSMIKRVTSSLTLAMPVSLDKIILESLFRIL